MLGRRWIARDILRRVLRRSLALVALGAQASALAAPLLDVPAAAREIAITDVAAGTASLTRSTNPGHQHDPATCPACIAQSIVALGSSPAARVVGTPTIRRLSPPDQSENRGIATAQVVRTRGPPLHS